MQTLVEGQTLLHDGRYRFLRRIGSGTFAVIMCAQDVQQQRHVAIKCVRKQEHNALGKREADILRHINGQDVDGACAVVRLLETFEEQGHFCLVLELLGPPVLNVERWGPWRRAPGSTRAPHRPVPYFKRQATDPGLRTSKELLGRREATLSSAPLSLVEVRQIAVHLCGALAFLHDKGLIHADVKPENVVLSGAEAPGGTSLFQSSCSSSVKLVDFGNCLEATELAAYAEEKAPRGFDVQTATYRAPEVAAGLLLCSAMDMWSLGCLLLECVSGEPFFTLVASGREQTQGTTCENDHLLEQIERVVTNGISLDIACTPYQSAALYNERRANRNRNAGMGRKRGYSTPLQELLQQVEPVDRHFHDFIFSLLDVNPATRVTAKSALFHPFLQAYFPFGMVFAPSNAQTANRDHEANIAVVPAAAIVDTKRNAMPSRPWKKTTQELSDRERKKKAAMKAASVRKKDLRQVLKIIPRDVPAHLPLSPR